jgi:prepilin-type N-terminal cleavage/methylation domain-containing protein
VRLRRAENGFTLIELLMVLVILAVLIAIAVPSFLGFRKRAEDRASQAVLRVAAPSVHAYAGDNDGSFIGMTAPLLKSQYDAGLFGFEVDSADDTSYCLRSTINPRTWYGAGPPHGISQTVC